MARDALTMLEKGEIDLLLTDVGLPDMPGTTLVAKALETRPALPMIFATGHSRVEGAQTNDRSALVVKPCQSWDIAAANAKVVAAQTRG